MEGLYKRYIQEREGLSIIERPEGFLLYALREFPWPHLYISDYYVLPEHRRKGIGYLMADEAFKEALKHQIKVVCCQCDELANGYGQARASIENFGFKEYEQEGSLHHFFMEVSQWEKRLNRLAEQRSVPESVEHF